MSENKNLKFRIEFNEPILDDVSTDFSNHLNGKLLENKILFFDQWGINFCEGFIDIENSEKDKPEIYFYYEIRNSEYSKKIKVITLIIEEKGLDYKISKINNQNIEIETNVSEQGGLSIYYNLTNEEEKNYYLNGIECLAERISDMKKQYYNYKVVSWR